MATRTPCMLLGGDAIPPDSFCPYRFGKMALGKMHFGAGPKIALHYFRTRLEWAALLTPPACATAGLCGLPAHTTRLPTPLQELERHSHVAAPHLPAATQSIGPDAGGQKEGNGDDGDIRPERGGVDSEQAGAGALLPLSIRRGTHDPPTPTPLFSEGTLEGARRMKQCATATCLPGNRPMRLLVDGFVEQGQSGPF